MTNRSVDPKGKPDAIIPLVRHTLASQYENLSPAAVQATKTFILDSFGVIIAGTLAPGVPQTLKAFRNWGGKEESTVLVSGPIRGVMLSGSACVDGVAYLAVRTLPRNTSASGWIPSGKGMSAMAKAVAWGGWLWMTALISGRCL